MSLIHSPSIVTNGLVMYFDMTNTMKSWKGAPTTNLVTYPLADWNGSSFALSYDYKGNGVGNATQTFDTSVETPLGDYSGVMKYTTGSAGITTYPDGYKYWAIRINGLTAGVTYTFSYYAKASIASNFENGQLWRDTGTDYGPSGDWNPTFTTEWRRYSTTRTMVGTYLDYFPIHSGNLTGGHTIYYWGFQMEVGSFATPFVAGTRSSTQSIVDLANKNTITVNTLTYNADNTFSFNNSASSTFNIPDSTLIRPGSVTISAWVNLSVYNPLNDFDGQFATIAWKGFDGQSGSQASYALTLVTGAFPRLTIAPSVLISSVAIPTNVWINIVGTYTVGGAMVLYRNGEVDITGTGPASISYSAQVFGIGTRTFNGAYQYPWNGSIGKVQLYDRALSAAEVRQNFNAHRGRYGV